SFANPWKAARRTHLFKVGISTSAAHSKGFAHQGHYFIFQRIAAHQGRQTHKKTHGECQQHQPSRRMPKILQWRMDEYSGKSGQTDFGAADTWTSGRSSEKSPEDTCKMDRHENHGGRV